MVPWPGWVLLARQGQPAGQRHLAEAPGWTGTVGKTGTSGRADVIGRAGTPGSAEATGTAGTLGSAGNLAGQKLLVG